MGKKFVTDWAEEGKKEIAGDIGKAIVKLDEEKCVSLLDLDKEAKKMNKKFPVITDHFLKRELERFSDFMNAWSGDSDYYELDDSNRVKKIVNKINPNSSFQGTYLEKNQGHAISWIHGYTTCSSRLYNKYNKLLLLVHMYLNQEGHHEIQA